MQLFVEDVKFPNKLGVIEGGRATDGPRRLERICTSAPARAIL
jgi:hypothetical protein